jgi:hypothetical protein
VVIAGDMLYDQKYLENVDRWWKVEKKSEKDPENKNALGLAPIKESRKRISKKLFQLYEEGQTALGMI